MQAPVNLQISAKKGFVSYNELEFVLYVLNTNDWHNSFCRRLAGAKIWKEVEYVSGW